MQYELLQEFKNSTLEGNELKSVIQELEIDTLLKVNKGVGYFENFTGFGKTRTGTRLIERYRAKYDYPIGILVPTKLIKDEWIKKLGNLKDSVDIYIINTYCNVKKMINRKWGMLIVDELHRICNEDAKLFSKAIAISQFDIFCGLTATLDNAKKRFLAKFGITSAFEITLQEGYALGLVPDFKLYNIGSELKPYEDEEYKRLNEIYNNTVKYYYPLAPDSVFSLLFACTVENDKQDKPLYKNIWINGEWRNQSHLNWIKTVAKYYNISNDQVKTKANMWRNAMTARNAILDNSENKLQQAKDIINEFSEKKSIIFTDSIKTADFLQENNPNLVSIHSKSKNRDTLHKDFLAGKYNQIATVQAYDEGVDVPSLEFGLQHYFTTKELTLMQRLGRILRYDEKNPKKRANFVSQYTRSFDDYVYQDEVQLNRSQKEIQSDVQIIQSIDQITW